VPKEALRSRKLENAELKPDGNDESHEACENAGGGNNVSLSPAGCSVGEGGWLDDTDNDDGDNDDGDNDDTDEDDDDADAAAAARAPAPPMPVVQCEKKALADGCAPVLALVAFGVVVGANRRKYARSTETTSNDSRLANMRLRSARCGVIGRAGSR